jgi:hypothetical protein
MGSIASAPEQSESADASSVRSGELPIYHLNSGRVTKEVSWIDVS